MDLLQGYSSSDDSDNDQIGKEKYNENDNISRITKNIEKEKHFSDPRDAMVTDHIIQGDTINISGEKRKWEYRVLSKQRFLESVEPSVTEKTPCKMERCTTKPSKIFMPPQLSRPNINTEE